MPDVTAQIAEILATHKAVVGPYFNLVCTCGHRGKTVSTKFELEEHQAAVIAQEMDVYPRTRRKTRAIHQHERSHVQQSAKGGFYCAACGDAIVCATCGGKLKPWREGWTHIDHPDWKLNPHDPVLKVTADA